MMDKMHQTGKFFQVPGDLIFSSWNGIRKGKSDRMKRSFVLQILKKGRENVSKQAERLLGNAAVAGVSAFKPCDWEDNSFPREKLKIQLINLKASSFV